MLRMKNWKLQINLKMLKDELEEQKTLEKLGYPANKSSCCRGTLHQFTIKISTYREKRVSCTCYTFHDG
jgi:hypothetical protein